MNKSENENQLCPNCLSIMSLIDPLNNDFEQGTKDIIRKLSRQGFDIIACTNCGEVIFNINQEA